MTVIAFFLYICLSFRASEMTEIELHEVQQSKVLATPRYSG